MRMTRPTWEIKHEEGHIVAEVTFKPITDPETVSYLRDYYDHQGDVEATEPVTLVLNGDDLSDLVAALEQAREKADAALFTAIDNIA